MLRRLKHSILERLGILRVADSAHAAAQAADRADHRVATLESRLAPVEGLRAVVDEQAAAGLAAAHDLDCLRAEVRDLDRWRRVLAHTAMAEAAPLLREPTFSVVLPTRDRCDQLQNAVTSVLAQRYGQWQLVVVDDGSSDGTATFLKGIDDPRVVVHRSAGVGAGAARNLAMGLASGEFVAFLDDDNVMHPNWLRAAAVHLARHHDCDVLYGAQLREPEPDAPEPRDPWLLFRSSFDRDELLLGNYIDMGALIVRRNHHQLWFDETLPRFVDWELIARMSAVTAPTPLPTLSGLYYTTGGTRITVSSDPGPIEAFSARLRDPADPAGSPRPTPERLA